ECAATQRAAARAPPVAGGVTSIGLEMVLIPAGSCWMGGKAKEMNRHPDEDPRHIVEISRPFYLGVYPVTQAQYQTVIDTNPSLHQPDDVDPATMPVD